MPAPLTNRPVRTIWTTGSADSGQSSLGLWCPYSLYPLGCRATARKFKVARLPAHGFCAGADDEIGRAELDIDLRRIGRAAAAAVAVTSHGGKSHRQTHQITASRSASRVQCLLNHASNFCDVAGANRTGHIGRHALRERHAASARAAVGIRFDERGSFLFRVQRREIDVREIALVVRDARRSRARR